MVFVAKVFWCKVSGVKPFWCTDFAEADSLRGQWAWSHSTVSAGSSSDDRLFGRRNATKTKACDARELWRRACKLQISRMSACCSFSNCCQPTLQLLQLRKHFSILFLILPCTGVQKAPSLCCKLSRGFVCDVGEACAATFMHKQPLNVNLCVQAGKCLEGLARQAFV